MRRPVRLFPLLLMLAALASCETRPPRATLTLSRVDYSELPGWRSDRQSRALIALSQSCPVMVRGSDGRPIGPRGIGGRVGEWRKICAALDQVDRSDDAAAREFFETWFTPYLGADRGDPEGLFTGYFEPVLNGSLTRGGNYTTPLYLRPRDLVEIDLGRFRQQFRGHRLIGRVVDGEVVPFPTRRQIQRGALSGQGLELVWVDDPVDAFFLHIQGSGSVVMPDGSVIRLGYDATNGHNYTAIGRELIARGEIPAEEMSMQAIRKWLAANPRQARSLMARNKSFIFFRQREGTGPYGAQAVMLTAGRSLAVDRRFISLGLPVWLDTTDPLTPERKLRRLFVAQDTGGAIRGPVRGDVYWGSGREAAERAGRMRQQGRYYLLLPKSAALPPTS